MFQATQYKHSVNQLENLLDAIDSCLPFWAAKFSEGKWKAEMLSEVLAYFGGKSQTDNNSSVNHSQRKISDCDSGIYALLQRTSEVIQALKAINI